MLKFLATIFILISTTNAHSLEKIGKISCDFFSNNQYFVSGDIYGETPGYNPVYVNIKILSNDKTLSQTTVLKTWNNVPYSQDSLWSIVFQNDDVLIDAFFDDVGAMSSINYDNNLARLVCDVSFN